MDLKNFWHVDGCPVTQPQQLINLFRSLILIASRKVALSFFVCLHSWAQHSAGYPFLKLVRILISTLNALSSRLLYSFSLINC